MGSAFGNARHERSDSTEPDSDEELQLHPGERREERSGVAPFFGPMLAVGRCEVAALCLFLILALSVIVKMAYRDVSHKWEPCVASTLLSKHEFCVNVTEAQLRNGLNGHLKG